MLNRQHAQYKLCFGGIVMKFFKKTAALMLVLVIVCQAIVTFAATNNKVTLKGPDNLEAGVKFEVSLEAEGDNIYGISGQITYDTESLKYVSASSSISGTWETEINLVEDILYYASADSEYKNPIKNTTEILTITFETTDNLSLDDVFVKTSNVQLSVDKKLLSVDDAEYRLEEEASLEDSVVQEKNDMYNNNLLESLIVKNATIEPEFSPEVQQYEATVPFTTDVLEVEAKPVSPTATVEYVDTELKYVGRNIVRVRVISESGLQRTYKIYVERQDKDKSTSAVDNGLQAWVIALIIIGALLIIAAIAVAILLIIKKKKKNIS